MYFEVAWTTSTTPSISSGRNRYGEGTVLSTTSGTPRWAQSAAMPRTSDARKVGFASVSIRTAPVSGRRAAAIASGSGSANVEEIP